MSTMWPFCRPSGAAPLPWLRPDHNARASACAHAQDTRQGAESLMITEDDIAEAMTRMPTLLERLDREWRAWKRASTEDRFLFDKYILPDRPGEPPRAEGIRIRVKKSGGEVLGYWRFEGGKFLFSRDADGDDHLFAAETESQAVRWTRAVCCGPRAGLQGRARRRRCTASYGG